MKTSDRVRISFTFLLIPFLFLPLFAGTSASRVQAYKKTPAVRQTLSQRPNPLQRKESAEHQLLQLQRRAAAEQKSGSTSITGIAGKKTGIAVTTNAASSSTIFLHDDFESGINGWSTVAAGNPAASWHLTSNTFSSPSHSWWIGSDSTGTYATGNRVKGSLVSPPVNLAGAVGTITLLFSEKYFTEHYWDFCMVDVTPDSGATWVNLRGAWGFAPSGNSGGWKISWVDLTPYANKTVQVRFAFDTGDSLFNSFPGWYVDDPVIFDQGGTISGDVYFDQNRNGLWDGQDQELVDWPVTIAGPITVTTLSEYGFSIRLPYGTYTVTEDLPIPWTQTAPAGGAFTVDLAQESSSIDTLFFGNYRPECLVTGSVFNDIDRDSVRQITDPPLPNWEITLLDGDDGWVDQVNTDSSGDYSFLVAIPGSYHLEQYLPSDWVSTVPGGRPPQYYFSISETDSLRTGNVFGSYQIVYVPPPNSVTISGNVFNDLNMNGVRDEREPGLAGFSVYASGPDWYGRESDSTGHFSFQGLPAGTYQVSMARDYTWGQSIPDSFYTLTLTDNQIIDTLQFGWFQRPTGTIQGTVYNDLNRNGVRDSLEMGLHGWTVTVRDSDAWVRSTVTDSAGRFMLGEIITGTHELVFPVQTHWHASLLNPVSAAVSAGMVTDSVEFGSYLMVPGSISGSVFTDVSADGIKNSGEPPLANIHITLTNGNATFGSTVTDDSGRYHFSGVWAGTYAVSMGLNAQWRQTWPALLQPFIVALGDEESRTGLDFGATNDTSLNPAFRSFVPESIAFSRDLKGKVGKLIPGKPNACDAVFDLMVPDNGLTGLHVEFTQVVDTRTITASQFDPSLTTVPGTRKFEFRMAGSDTLVNGAHVILSAHGTMGKELYLKKYWWAKGTVSPYPYRSIRTNIHGTYKLLYPVPNVNNLLYELYTSRYLGTSGIEVGDPGTPRYIYHPKWGDVLKTLAYHTIIATANPTCIGHILPNKPVTTRPYKSLRPDKGGNVLFSEAIALKVGIALSDIGVDPPGFGSLIFQGETGNPFNGRSIYELAALADTAISSFDFTMQGCRYDSIYFKTLYQTIRMIDSAFSGPMNVYSWDGSTIAVKPIRYISDVSFLHLDPGHPVSAGPWHGYTGGPGMAQEFRLDQNYPNPFNPVTAISFTLPQESFVTLKIYDVLGREVATLLNHSQMDDGDQELEFNGSNLASGVYFYRISAEGIADNESGTTAQTFTSVRRMILIK
jgi:hypothetical protein